MSEFIGGVLTSTNPGEVSRVSRNFNIANMLMEGIRVKEIAEKVGLSRKQVYNIASDDKIVKQLIAQATKVQAINAVNHSHKLVEIANDSTDRKIQLAAIKMCQQNTGVAPSHTTNRTINTLYMQNNVAVGSEVIDIIGKHMSNTITDTEVCDDDPLY